MCYKIFISLRKRNILRQARHVTRLLAMRLALAAFARSERPFRECFPSLFIFLLSFFLIPRQQPLDLYQFL